MSLLCLPLPPRINETQVKNAVRFYNAKFRFELRTLTAFIAYNDDFAVDVSA